MTVGDQLILEQGGFGELIDLEDLDDDQRIVDPAIVSQLLAGPDADAVDPRGLLIRWARFEAPLRLSFCDARRPLTLNGCELRSLTGRAIDVAFDLTLYDCRVSGTVEPTGAHVGADLGCNHTTMVGSRDALSMNRADIGGTCS